MHSEWFLSLVGLLLAALWCSGCSPRPGAEAARHGDEIVVCGRAFHTGAPVVLWTDPGGYDAYRTEKRFVAWPNASWKPTGPEGQAAGPETPNRYGVRFAPGSPDGPLTPDEFERIRAGGWDLPTLQRCVDQFVLHYDASGVSRQCFRTLHDLRGLSVHFMLDLDGTIYQTLDVKEKAWHATTSNDRSIGIEIANVGAYGDGEPDPFARWYSPFNPGSTTPSTPTITIPDVLGDGGIRTPAFVGRPARPGPIVGEIQGKRLRQFDLTPQQYDSLARLAATLCTIFPNLPCDYPRDDAGMLVTRKLDDERLRPYHGLLGHYHIQSNKVDPGPALQWDLLLEHARSLMSPPRGSTQPLGYW